jgi:hypothetical protein
MFMLKKSRTGSANLTLALPVRAKTIKITIA